MGCPALVTAATSDATSNVLKLSWPPAYTVDLGSANTEAACAPVETPMVLTEISRALVSCPRLGSDSQLLGGNAGVFGKNSRKMRYEPQALSVSLAATH